MKNTSNDYPLIPMSEISDEAREIAVIWVEQFETYMKSVSEKQKLASDFMNYARRHFDKKLKEELPDIYNELNISRIKTYQALAEQFNIDVDTVGKIFNKGGEWYKKEVEQKFNIND